MTAEFINLFALKVLFQSLIVSQLEYAGIVWALSNKRDIDVWKGFRTELLNLFPPGVLVMNRMMTILPSTQTLSSITRALKDSSFGWKMLNNNAPDILSG